MRMELYRITTYLVPLLKKHASICSVTPLLLIISVTNITCYYCYCCEGVILCLCGTAVPLSIPQMIQKRIWSSGGMAVTRKDQTTRRKTRNGITLFTTNPTCTALGTNPDLRVRCEGLLPAYVCQHGSQHCPTNSFSAFKTCTAHAHNSLVGKRAELRNHLEGLTEVEENDTKHFK
jgi:hypothetical protein